MAETVEAQDPLPVDQQQAGRAAQAIAPHGHRNAGRIVMAIDRDRPDAAILVQEVFQRTRRHTDMTFEHAVPGAHPPALLRTPFLNPPQSLTAVVYPASNG